MQNGVTHESYFFWNEPYVYPSYFGTVNGEYPICTKKVNFSNYVTLPPNSNRDAEIKEEIEMIDKINSHIDTGKAFKDTYG